MEQRTPAAVIAMAVLVVIAAGIIVITLLDGPHHQSLRSGTGTTAGMPDPKGIPANSSPAPVSRNNAPDACTMVPRTGLNTSTTIGYSYSNLSVFTPESAGNFSSALAKTGAVISREQAENSTREAFPYYSPDLIALEYSDGGINSRMWKFDLRKDGRQLVLGTLDAYTGELTGYNVVFSRFLEGTPEVSRPATLSMEDARLAAETEIRKRNGELPVTLVGSRVDYDGNYFFNYRRVIQGVPCYKDGITVTVDPGTGNVVMYSKTWNTPENAVAAQPVPAVSRDAAIALVEREAVACYPESADSFRIVAADLRWMDLYNQEKYIPAPGVIPLVWHVQFDDATIRAWEFPNPEEGWVDAQNGTLQSMAYFHCRSNCG